MTTYIHDHPFTGELKPAGECHACDVLHFKPQITSEPGEQLEVEIDIDDNAGPDELAAAMEAAAREAGLL